MAFALKRRPARENKSAISIAQIALCAVSSLLVGCGSYLNVQDNGQQSSTGNTSDQSSSSSSSQSSSEDQSTEPEPACALNPSQASFGAWIDARCEKMIKCCDASELTSFLGADNTQAASCKKTLTDTLMAQQSSPERAEIMNSFDASFAAAIYLVSTKTTEVRAGCLAGCMSAQAVKDCSKRSKDRCEATDDYPGGPCDPNLIFHGTLQEKQECDPALAKAGLDVQCRYGLDCMADQGGKYRCKKVPAIGESCTPDSQALQGNCEYDAVCDPKTKTCVKGAPVGAACNHKDGESFIGCLPGLLCGQDKRCVPACQAGAQCSNEDGHSDDRRCPDNFFCHPGEIPYCMVRGNEQGSCDSDGDCPSNQYCSSAVDDSPIGAATVGACSPKKSEGECSRDGECGRGFVCDEDGQCKTRVTVDTACSKSRHCDVENPFCAFVDRKADGSFQVLSSVCSDGKRNTAACKIKDPGLTDAPALKSYLRPELLRLQTSDAPWFSVCKKGGCEQDSDGKGRCTAYAQQDQACDYLVSDALPSCAPGLVCVKGTCAALLPNDAPCDPASEEWSALDAEHSTGFDASVCDPSTSRCVREGEGSGRCRVDPERAELAICDGE